MDTAGEAWQHQIRRVKAAEGAGQHNTDIGAAQVRRIDIATARVVIEEYEWLGKMPAITWYAYGIYFGEEEELGGVVCYGPEYGENLGVWDKYGYTGKIICLSRGACCWWAHPHSASKLICASMKLLPPRFEVVTCTVDAGAGEVGTIYQACNFSYAPMGTHSRNGAIINGRTYTSRSLRSVFGHGSIQKLKAEFGSDAVVSLPEKPKGRYYAFRGSRGARKHNRAAIGHLVKPYPHRDPEAAPAGTYEGKT